MFLKKFRLVFISLFFFLGLCQPIDAKEDVVISIGSNDLMSRRFIDYASQYIYLYDLDNQQLIYENNGESTFYPASLTKMMTLIVGIENISDINQMITLDETIFQGLVEAQASRAGFGIGDSVSVLDLFYGIMLPSGAECTRAIAKLVSGSEEGYVQLMNEKAQELGMDGTHFINTSGLHDSNHYSTAKDMATLLQYCLNNDLFYQIFTTFEYTSAPTTTYPLGLTMESTTKRYCKKIYDGTCPSLLLGSKTGFTNPAQYCLASLGEANGHRYILVTGGAPWEDDANNVTDAINTYQYIQEHQLSYVPLYQANETIADLSIKGTRQHIVIQADESIGIYGDDVNAYVEVNEPLQAPILSNSHVATLVIEDNRGIIGQVPIVVETTIAVNNWVVLLEKMIEWLNHYWLIITGCGIVLFGLSFVWIRIEKKKARRRALARRKALRKARYESKKE